MSGPRDRNTDPVVVLTTLPDHNQARDLARRLVEARLSACVSLLPGVTSFFRWEGRTSEEAEVLLLIKTRRDRLGDLERWLLEHHPYDVPEFLGLETAVVSSTYLAWLRQATDLEDGGEP